MKKTFSALVLTSLLGAVSPLLAGTVYVPLAIDSTVGGNQLTTELRFHNDSGEAASLSYLFIPATQDGTLFDRETEMTRMSVAPRVTMRVNDLVPVGRRGVLEIQADDAIHVTARLVSTDSEGVEKLGVELPVITSDNAVQAGKTAILQGLNRVEGLVQSDFSLVNLGINRGQCAVEVLRRGGTMTASEVISIPPLSVFPFDDVLGLLGVANGGDVSVAVTCDQLAYTYALNQRLGTAEVLVIPPSGSGQSRLDPFPTSSCPDDALFRLDGDFHIPEPRGGERATFFVPTTDGEVFSRLTLTMEFTHAGWHQRSSANHAVFWLNRTERWRSNVFGYFNLFGPNRNIGKNLTNVNLPAGVVDTAEQGANFVPGETYAVSYIYDTENRFIEVLVLVKSTGEEVLRLADAPTVNRITSGNEWMLVFGHTSHEEGPEVPTYGWTYSNLCLTLE